MPNENNSTNDQQNPKPELVTTLPSILRALASYLEVDGESEKFSNYLSSLQESDSDDDVVNPLDVVSQSLVGERPGPIG